MREATATLTALAILAMRDARDEDELREVIFQANWMVASICANLALELEKVDCGADYIKAIAQHLPPAIEAMVESLRTVRAHYIIPETEVVN